MPDKIGIWRERLKTTAGDTTLTQACDPVPTGERWYLQRVALRNQTRQNSDVLVYIQCPGYKHALHYAENLGNNTFEGIAVETWLREGEYLAFDWSGILTSDVVESHITGHKRYDGGGLA